MDPLSFRPAGDPGGIVKTVPLIVAIRLRETETPIHSRKSPGERTRAREKMVRAICRMYDAGHKPTTIRRSVGLTMAEIFEILNKHRPEPPDPADGGIID